MLFADENIKLILDLAKLHDPDEIIKNFIAGINAQTKSDNFYVAQIKPEETKFVFPIETGKTKYGFLCAQNTESISEEDKTRLKKVLELLKILLSKNECEVSLNNNGSPVQNKTTKISPEISMQELRESQKAAINLVEDLYEEIEKRNEKENELKESEARYHTLFDSTLEALVIHKEGKILEVNDTFLQMYECIKDKVIGRTPLDFIAKESIETAKKSMIEKPNHPVEHVARKCNGDTFNVLIDAKNIEYKGEECRLVSIRDITARKAAEDALKKSEKRYRTQFEQFPIPIFEWKMKKGNFFLQGCNKAAERISGQNFNKIKDIQAEVLYSSFETDLLLKNLYECYEKKITINSIFEYELSTTGEKKWIKGTWIYIEPDTVLLHTEDFTKRKLYEEQIVKSKERYQFLLENLQEGIWQIDENAVTVYTNEKLVEILGYKPEEMIGKPLFDFMNKEWRKKAETYFDDRKKGVKTTHEFCFEHKNGDHVYTLLSTAPLEIEGEFKGALASIIDITEKKNVEKALHKSKTILEEAEEIASLGAWELDIKKKTFYFSDAWLIIHGVDESVMHIDKLMTLAHPDDRERISAAFEKALKKNKPYEIEHRIINQKTKEVRNIKAYGKIVTDENDHPFKMFGAALDITGLKKATAALEESEALLREAENIAKIGSWKYDIASDKVMWSDEMFKIFEVDKSDGEPSWAAHRKKIHPDDWERLDSAVKAAAEKAIPYKDEFRIQRSDGSVKWAETLCNIIEDENGKPKFLSGTVQEITARKIAEDLANLKMKELQKLNSFMVDRETKMIELKKEINDMLVNAGKPKKYNIPQE